MMPIRPKSNQAYNQDFIKYPDDDLPDSLRS